MGRKRPEEHANHERWLVSYADFITLLFAFFVVMYAISEVDSQRLKQVVGAIRFATHFEGTGGIDRPPIFEGPRPPPTVTLDHDVPNPSRPDAARLEIIRIKEEIVHKLGTMADGHPIADVVEVTVTEEGVRIRLMAAYFFDQGSAVLRPEAIPVVDTIARVIQEVPHQVRVEGHSDDQGGKDRLANWRLSSDRSLTIIRYLLEGFRIEPARLSMAAFAQYRPVATNRTVEGRAANRRIDMFIIHAARPAVPN